jgi:hypothetical protein
MAAGGKRSFLDSIPGWSGYRDRERRRESDRLLRERLARDYGEIADRLGRLASRLAADRKLMAIRFVDGPLGRLNHFIDRLRTATYGYAGLFSVRPVDERALDQIAAFDASLGEGLDELDAAANALEQTDPDDAAFSERSENLTDLIEKLLVRFDRRAELIESGAPQPEIEISALLGTRPQPRHTPTAYQLHDGDAVTFRNVNYTIVGRITIETATGSWRDFQLQGGDGRSWLHVPGSAGGRFVWYRRVEPQGQGGDRELTADGTRYELTGSLEGTAEVIGSGGSSGNREMTAHSYRQVSGDGLLSVYHWRADDIALAGEPIDATELELWSREGGQAI